MTLYKLEFEDRNEKRRELARFSAHDDAEAQTTAFPYIRIFCQEHNFEIPYVRVWKAGGKIHFDVGSHVEFFHVYEI